MKRIIIILLMMGYTLNSWGQDSLGSYLQYAYAHHPSLKAAYTRFEIALQQVPQVKALPDPKVSFGFFISPVETRVGPQQAKFSLSQQFPWFGTLEARGNAAVLKAEAFYQGFIEERNRIGNQVKMAYYPIYELNQHIKWQEENLEILKSYKLLATTAFSNGKGTLTDALRVDIMIENTKTDIQILKDKLRPLEIVFNRKLNREEAMGVSIAETLTIESLEADYRKDSLTAQNPSLQAFDIRIKAAKAQEEVAKKNALPKFGLGLDYALVGSRTDANPTDNGKNILMPMVSVSLPISKSKYNAAIKEQQLKQLMLQSKKEAVVNNLWADYETAWYSLDKSITLNKLYNQQIKKTIQVIDLLQTSYSNSGKDFEEILRMQQQLLKYQMAKASVVKDYYLALAKLDYLTAKSN